MKIIFASHTYMDPHLVVGSQHLAKEFAKMGHDVLHLSCPITPGHLLLKNQDARYTARVDIWKMEGKFHQENLLEAIPLSPIPWKLARRFISEKCNPYAWFLPGTARLIKKHGFHQADLLLIDEPRFMGIEKWLHPTTLIYRATDFYARMKNDPSIDIIEKWLVQKSHALVGTSLLVLQHLQNHAPGKPALLLENGVDNQHLANASLEPEECKGIPHPRAIYVGALDDRFDFYAIKTLAQSLPGVQFILIGPVIDAKNSKLLDRLPNLHLIGQIAYEKIPGWLQHADVGLLPVNDHPANDGRSPMKLYEYAAAGLPVVSKGTTEILRRNEPFVRIYDTSQDAVKVLTELLDNLPPRETNLREAVKHSWSARASTLLQFCDSIQT